MKIDYEQIRQGVEKALNDTFFTNNSKNQENFKNVLLNRLTELQSEGYIEPEPKLESVKVADEGNGQISVNLMRAFKNFSKSEQERIYCEMADISRDDVAEFIYNDEGYIEDCKLKQSIDSIVINITVE